MCGWVRCPWALVSQQHPAPKGGGVGALCIIAASMKGTIYNPSSGRPSAGEVVQILGTVQVLPHGE